MVAWFKRKKGGKICPVTGIGRKATLGKGTESWFGIGFVSALRMNCQVLSAGDVSKLGRWVEDVIWAHGTQRAERTHGSGGEKEGQKAAILTCGLGRDPPWAQGQTHASEQKKEGNRTTQP